MPTGQIFCDESEATPDGHRRHLLVAAVAIDPKLAKGLMTRFRKKARIKDEIKGHELLIEQRQAFFAMMAEYAPEAAAIVICDREHRIGGAMMSILPGHDLWAELVAEACLQLKPPGPALTVTPDGGRYTQRQIEILERRIGERLAVATGIQRVRVRCEPSEAVPGLQVADIIANSATHARHVAGKSAEVAAQLLDARGVSIRDAEFPFIDKPGWLVA